MFTYTHRPPLRMRVIWHVLESAKDVGRLDVVAACRRLIQADKLGWAKHHRPADWAFVENVFLTLEG